MPSFAAIKQKAEEKLETAGPVGKVAIAAAVAIVGTVTGGFILAKIRDRRG